MKAVLNYKKGTSDKTYVVEKVAATGSAGLFVVNFAYGRRGSTLRPGTKTKNPVTEAEADKIFEKIVNGQLPEGYVLETGAGDGGGCSFSVEEAVQTRFPVHLLNEITETQALALLQDDDYYAQEKHDGHRTVLVLENDEIYGSNKRALRVGIHGNFSASLAELRDIFGDSGRELKSLALDGEAVGERFFAFDLLEYNGNDFRTAEFYQRYAGLESLFLDAGENSLLRKRDFKPAGGRHERKNRAFQPHQAERRRRNRFQTRPQPLPARTIENSVQIQILAGRDVRCRIPPRHEKLNRLGRSEAQTAARSTSATAQFRPITLFPTSARWSIFAIFTLSGKARSSSPFTKV